VALVFVLAASAQEPAAAPAPAPPADVLARVNGTEIRRGDVVRRLMTMIQDRGLSARPEDFSELKPEVVSAVVEEMVVESLLDQAARAAGLEASDEETGAALEGFKKSLPEDFGFQEYLLLYSATVPMIKGDLARNIRVQKLIGRLTKDIEPPTDAEIEQFYNENRDDFVVEPQVEGREIFISAEGLSDVGEVEQRGREALAIRERLVGDAAEPFEKVAREVSDAPGAKDGGKLGPFNPDEVSEMLAAAALKQPIGAIGPVFPSDGGFRILKVERRSEGRTIPLDEAKPRIARVLHGKVHNQMVLAYIAELKASAQIERFDQRGEGG
jgi:parvulin-like peptidyl-prolyl isomerase